MESSRFSQIGHDLVRESGGFGFVVGQWKKKHGLNLDSHNSM